jgi:branched-chain amino acid transport system permease protein
MAIGDPTIFGVNPVLFLVGLGNFVALYVAISLSLNLEAGYTGIPNFGKVLFVAGGASVAGAISGRLATYLLGIDTHGNYIVFNAQAIAGGVDPFLATHIPSAFALLLVSVLIAALIGGALGYLASYPAVRLREDYLGMLLLASAQFYQVFLSGFEPLIGGTQGILVPDPYAAWAGAGPGVRDAVALGVISLFAFLVYVFVERIARSPLGRTLRAIRDNEEASEALGKDNVAIRKKVLVIASAISAMAGALLTFYVGSVGADTWTRIDWTFWPWLMVIMGGVANNTGVVLGSLVFGFTLKFLQQIRYSMQPYFPIDVNWVQYLAFGTLLIVILMVRPDGILPEKPSATLGKSRISAIIEASGRDDRSLAEKGTEDEG